MAAHRHLRSRARAFCNLVQPILPLPFITVEQQIHKCIKVYGSTANKTSQAWSYRLIIRLSKISMFVCSAVPMAEYQVGLVVALGN